MDSHGWNPWNAKATPTIPPTPEGSNVRPFQGRNLILPVSLPWVSPMATDVPPLRGGPNCGFRIPGTTSRIPKPAIPIRYRVPRNPHSGFWILDSASRAPCPETRNPDLGFRIPYRIRRVPKPAFRIPKFEFRISNPPLPCPLSRFPSRKSRIPSPVPHFPCPLSLPLSLTPYPLPDQSS